MTKQTDLDDLDRRASAAAADLRGLAARRPVTDFEPERPLSLGAPGATRHRMDRRPLLAVAAVLALLVGAAGWFVSRPDTGADKAATVTTDSLRGYLAGDLPDGLALTGVYEGLGAPTNGEVGAAELYGPAADRPRLVAFAVDSGWASDAEGEVQVSVGDRTGYLLDWGGPRILIVPSDAPSDVNPDAGAAGEGPDGGGPALYLMSADLDRDQLVAAASAAEVGGSNDPLAVTIPDMALPEGWSHVGTEPDGLAASSSMSGAGGLGSGSRIAAYVDGGRFVSVSSRLDRSGHGVGLAMLSATDPEDIAVHGHPALVGEVADGPGGPGTGGPGMSGVMVAWEERPGEVVTVSGRGVSREELLALAEGVHPATEADWAELVEQTQLGDLSPDYGGDGGSAKELGRGRFADGTAWVLRHQEGNEGLAESLQLHVAVTSDGTASESFSEIGQSLGGDDTPLPQDDLVLGSSSRLEKGGRGFGSGLVSNDVAAVELRRADGTVAGTAEIVSRYGVSAWVAELPDDAVILVALDSTGGVMADQPLPGASIDEGFAPSPGPTATTAGG